MSLNKFKESEKITRICKKLNNIKRCLFPMGIGFINTSDGNTILKSGAELQKVFFKDWGH